MTRTIWIAAGGTGGHVLPSRSLGDYLQQRGDHVTFVTDKRGMVYLQDVTSPVYVLPATHFAGSWIAKIMALLKLTLSCLQSFLWILKKRPTLVIGFGGYASFPTVLAARLTGIPVILHQADALVGQTNRLLARCSHHLALSFANTQGAPLVKKLSISVTGLPLRTAFYQDQPTPYQPSAKDQPFHLLVTGGSQGAEVFSTLLPQAIESLPDDVRKRLVIVQQCHAKDIPFLEQRYTAMGIIADLSPFLEDMPTKLAHCHLMIGRGGASSILECAAVGRPMIIIPYPLAKDDHQTINAQQVVEVQGGWMMAQRDLRPLMLADLLMSLMQHSSLLEQAAKNMTVLACADTLMRFTTVIDELLETRMT